MLYLLALHTLLTLVEYLCPFQVPKNLELLKGSEPLHYFHYFYPPVFL